MVSLSIIIVTHDRIEMLKALLQSIFKSNLTLQVIVINNSNITLDLSEFEVFLISKKHNTPGEARNTGLKYVRNDWILFLDDDVILPDNYLNKNLNFISNHNNQIDMIGGPDQTLPNASFFQECLGKCLQSPMTTAKTRYRHKNDSVEIKSGDEKNLILCNLWLKRSFYNSQNIEFNKDFFRNEENIFITEALRNGAKAIYKSDFYVFHHRKSNPFSLTKSTFSSGKYRAKSFFYATELFDPLFLVPAIWVLYILLIPALSSTSYYTLAPLFTYFILSMIFSIKIAKGQPFKAVVIMAYQIQINFIYGLGIIYGLLLNGLNICRRFGF